MRIELSSSSSAMWGSHKWQNAGAEHEQKSGSGVGDE